MASVGGPLSRVQRLGCASGLAARLVTQPPPAARRLPPRLPRRVATACAATPATGQLEVRDGSEAAARERNARILSEGGAELVVADAAAGRLPDYNGVNVATALSVLAKEVSRRSSGPCPLLCRESV